MLDGGGQRWRQSNDRLHRPFDTPPKDGHHDYTLIFAGFVWCFTVSSHSQTHAASRYWLQRDGSLSVFPFDVTRSPGFLRMALGLHEENKQGIEELRAKSAKGAPRG